MRRVLNVEEPVELGDELHYFMTSLVEIDPFHEADAVLNHRWLEWDVKDVQSFFRIGFVACGRGMTASQTMNALWGFRHLPDDFVLWPQPQCDDLLGPLTPWNAQVRNLVPRT